MLLEWISHSDFPAQKSAIIRERREGTGQLLLTASELIQWKSEVKATLFCPGIPGATSSYTDPRPYEILGQAALLSDIDTDVFPQLEWEYISPC
jgi:hypothetical protein